MTISVKIENSVARLSIDRPAQKNAISAEMWKEIEGQANALKNADLRLLLIRGEGGMFSAGADLSELGQLADLASAKNYWANIKRALDVISGLEFPTVAVVEKYCFGGGCLLALACDLRYASDDALFQIPVAKNGWILDQSTVARLSHLVGPSNAKELIFLASTKGALQAKAIGLVNEIWTSSQLEHEVEHLVEQVLKAKSFSICQLKKQIDSCFSLPLDLDQDALAREEERIAERFLPSSLDN
jgi:enoyl-CoA hydratase/carnithine racemase